MVSLISIMAGESPIDLAGLADLALEYFGLGDEILLVEGIAYSDEQAIEIRRLGYKVIGAFFDGIDRSLQRCHDLRS
jgi:hypothetical protein